MNKTFIKFISLLMALLITFGVSYTTRALTLDLQAASAGVGIYDDADSNIIYGGSWLTYVGSGPYSNTEHYTSTVGSTASFTFSGSQFVFSYLANTNRGNIEVTVDGTVVTTINANGPLNWQKTYTSPVFSTGTHTVIIKFTGPSGTYGDVDAIQVINPDLVAPSAVGSLTAETGAASGSLNLSWTAPMNDAGNAASGSVSAYQVRYSKANIATEADWNAATAVTSGIPTPGAVGASQGMTVSGLTPGATYYLAVRGQDTQPNLGPIVTASGVSKAASALGAGKYDDPHAGWVYGGSWLTYVGSGPYSNTEHYTSTVGSTASFTFSGSQFVFSYLANTNRGNMEVTVDGTVVTTINANGPLSWQKTYTSPVFSSGTHTVVIKFTGPSGTYGDVDAINIASISTPPANTSFSTGWWLDREADSPSIVTSRAQEGNTLMLLAGWFVSTSQLSETIQYLDKAQAAGVQLIIGLEGGATPTMSDSAMTTVINSLKVSPALYGYYIGDEPEMNVSAETLAARHATLLHYYQLIKSLDPNHPIMISFNQPYSEQDWQNQMALYDATDILGIHAYPFWSTGGEFGTREGRTIYDIWLRLKNNAASNNKSWACTMQGFGNGVSPYKNPTLNELRYETFSAIALGCPVTLFWIDSWGVKAGMMDTVKTVIGTENQIATAMSNGVTNSGVTVSGVTTNQLVYRYGADGKKNVILAVNIANRTGSGTTLSNVSFTLPSSVSVTQVTVLGENRTIPVVNGSFTDTFKPFEVHIYSFTLP